MVHSAERSLALRFCLTTVGLLACLFGWVCVLTFNAADPPSDSVWVPDPRPSNPCGPVGAWLAYQLYFYLGASTYAFLGLLTLIVFAWAKGVRLADLWLRLVGLALTCTAISAWAAMLISPSDRYLMSGPGGVLGAGTAYFFRTQFQEVGTHIVLTCALLVGLVLAADELLLRVFRGVRTTGERSIPVLTRSGTAIANAGVAVVTGVASGMANLSSRLGGNGQRRGATLTDEARDKPVDKLADETPAGDSSAAMPPCQLTFDSAQGLPTEGRANATPDAEPTESKSPEAPAAGSEPTRFVADRSPAVSRGSEPITPMSPSAGEPAIQTSASRPAAPRATPRRTPASSPDDDYRLPSIELLERPTPIDKDALEILCREKAYILEQTLNEFRVTVQVVAIETGPVITVFELKLAPGVKVSQIASLANDMARALKAPAVRVVAPLPGKNTIGIEVPNIDKEKVRLRDVMEAFARRADGFGIPLYLGKDASGQPLVTDLTRMPHLLIAGTTGSGKSVCVSSIILSILLTRTPTEINLILIDPKMVELAAYRDIPHLMCPIITDMQKAETILDWAATMMDERYALLAEVGVRDIRSYNRLGRTALKERLKVTSDEELGRTPIHLPYVIMIVDELADLMMTSAKEVEFYLCRLAQKSRAVGIHLIVSTQRPQANVVTGLIKSNLPCRVAFRVSSRLDSRIVLDQNGGETLLGQGDMLFLPPGSSKLIRAQGTFVSDDELRRVVSRAKEQRPPNYHPELVRVPGADAVAAGERDELFDQAVEAVLDTGRGSVSLLQRRLEIGYGRASRLIDQMYEAGIVGEYKGSQAREVIMSKEEWQAVRAQRNREEAAEAAHPADSPIEDDPPDPP